MKYAVVFSFFSIFILLFTTGHAQKSTNKTSWLSKHPIEFSSGSHSISLPFNKFLSPPYYPEINLGLQSDLLNKKNSNVNIVNGLGLASHTFNGDRYFVYTFLRYKHQFPFNLYGQVGLGPSLNLLTYPNTVYELNSSGIYEEKNSAEIKLHGGFNMEIGYRLKSIQSFELDIFSKYNTEVQFFHHPEISIFPYNSIQIGMRFYFNKNNSK